MRIKAPFPYFGGKSRVSDLVWDRFGNVPNYVEPFFGSGAVLINRPSAPGIETVNDLDCMVANFWRALQADPEQLAAHADWPVNEADLHARHLWLVNKANFRERMKTDPEYFDVKIAGWWVWGICQWIGSGWCCVRDGIDRSDGTPRRGRPNLSTGQGVQQNVDVPNQIPNLRGDSGAAGSGIHASGKMPRIDGRPRGMNSGAGMEENNGGGLYEWFYALADRLRRVRVCCGDWKRILGPAPTTCIGTTGVFLDPPYAVEERSDVYSEESREVAYEVREWAIANGDNPELRIALCGYDATCYRMPPSWTEIAWKANGGYANQSGKTRGRANAHRERIWFSPFCLRLPTLFDWEEINVVA